MSPEGEGASGPAGTDTGAGDRGVVDAPGPWRGWTPALRVSVVGLFLLAVVYAISLARPVLLPLIVAGLLALVLAPMVSVLEGMRLPRWLGSAITVAGFVALVGFGGYRVAGPAMEWVRDLPVSSRRPATSWSRSGRLWRRSAKRPPRSRS